MRQVQKFPEFTYEDKSAANVSVFRTTYNLDSIDGNGTDLNEAALLEHLELISPLSQKYKIDWKVNRLELCGNYSEEVVTVWKVATKQNEFLYFNESVV